MLTFTLNPKKANKKKITQSWQCYRDHTPYASRLESHPI